MNTCTICPACHQDVAICIFHRNTSSKMKGCYNKKCLCIKYEEKYSCKYSYKAKCFYTNYINFLLTKIKELDIYAKPQNLDPDESEYALQIINAKYNALDVFCNFGLIYYYLENFKNSSVLLFQIKKHIGDIVTCVYKADAKLYGGFVRDYYNYVLEHKFKISEEKCKTISAITNIILEYYDDYIPDITKDFKDIDIWITHKGQFENLKSLLSNKGFKFEEVQDTNWKKENISPSNQFSLSLLKVMRGTFTCFLDIVYCHNNLPVNDFSCNLLIVELKNNAETYMVHNTGIKSLSKDYYFKFDFTVQQILRQIRHKIIYILPDFIKNKHWVNRLQKFKEKGYTIINRSPEKNIDQYVTDLNRNRYPDNLIVNGLQLEKIIF